MFRKVSLFISVIFFGLIVSVGQTTQAQNKNTFHTIPAQAHILSVQSGNLPLSVSSDEDVSILTLNSEDTELLSPANLAFSVETLPTDIGGLIIDYGELLQEVNGGGSFAQRLTLYEVSGCQRDSVTVDRYPDNPNREPVTRQEIQCESWEALPSENDLSTQELHVELADLAVSSQRNGELADPLYVLATTSSSQEGDYSFTPLDTVSTYEVSLNSGAMVTSYPIPVPPARAGAAPNVVLTYNSGIVDGMHQRKNNQPGTIGIGWSLQSGYITRHLKTCEDNPQAPEDLCLIGDEYTITLNGVSSRLVKDSGNLYRLQDDPYWKVEMFSDGHASNPDTDKEYWIVTTPDGTQFRFGNEIVPETGEDQNSVFYVPVYDLNVCDINAPVFALCNKAWQWNLDRIEDTNGNVTNFFYNVETSYYNGRSDSSSAFRREYVRAGHVERIEYTTQAGQVETPNARVLFNSEIRCSDATSAGACDWPSDFPDTPDDLGCESSGTCSQNMPTFWTQRRVGNIQTQVYDQGGSYWRTAATYNLTQDFPVPSNDNNGDSSEAKLWLDEVAQHEGGAYTHWAFGQIEAEDYDDSQGANIKIEDTIDVGRGQNSGGEAGEYLVFENVNFDAGATSVIARVASNLDGRRIEFRLDDPDNPPIAALNFDKTGGWQTWDSKIIPITATSGIHDLYVRIEGGGFNINWIRFATTNTLNSLPAVEYDYEMKANRRNFALAGVSPMFMPRIDQITTELGGTVDFTFGQSHPCPTSSASYVRYPYDCFIAWDAGTPDDNGADDGFVLWNKWKVLSQSSVDSFSGNPAQTISFEYSAPTWHYNNDPTQIEINACSPSPCPTRHWNDWRGSAVVTVTDSTGAKTEHRFHRGMDGDRFGVSGGTYSASITLSDDSTRIDSNWLRGHKVEQRRLSSSDTPLTRMVNEFYAVNTIDGDTDIYDAYFVAVDKSDDTLFIGTDETTRTEMTYDSYGNVTRQIWHGDVTITADDRNLETEYLYNTTDYIVNRPYYERLWSGTGSSSLPNAQAYTVYQYDDLGFNVAPTKGNMTQVREHWSTDPTDMFYETAFDYDSRGRQTHVTDARNNTSETQYHSFYGYVESNINALSHTMQMVVDPAWGHVTQATDPNNAVTTIEYDDYGRLTHVWLPDQNPAVDPASSIFNYFPDARPAYIQTRQLTDQGNSIYIENWEYVDGFGRPIQQQTTSPTAFTRSVTSQQYDNLGRIEYESVTFEAGGVPGGNYILMDWPTRAGYHLTEYDDLSRPTARRWRNGNTTIWSDTTNYDGWRTTFTDANGSTMEQLTDAFSQLVEVVEHPNPITDYTTTYEYNIRGELIQVTDDDSNITTMSYDLLGRKTSMDDPDMGQWYYDYDSVGNLVSQVDARAKGICSYYDELNRITGKVYDAGTIANPASYTCQSNPSTLDITYAYDEAGHGAGIGRLTSVTDEAGTHSQDYNSRGLLTSETRTIQNAPSSYTQSYTYDALDRQQTVTYPNGEVVTTAYNVEGLPQSLIGNDDYVSDATYNVRGQMLTLDRGNGVDTAYQYYGVTERFRFQRTNDAALDQWVDSYDDVGNVKMLRTRYGSSAEPAVTFNYDGLNRLLSATGSPYNRSYTYDSLGNITSLAGQSYQYNSSRPHAVTNVGSDTYSYDASGNMTSRTEDSETYTQVFDVENRLVTVNKPDGGRLEFLYDHTGQRMRTVSYLSNGAVEKYTFYPFATYEQETIPAVPTAVEALSSVEVARTAQDVAVAMIGVMLVTLAAFGVVTRRRGWWRLLLAAMLLAQFIPAKLVNAQTVVSQTRLNYLFSGQVIAVRTTGISTSGVFYLHNDHVGSATVLTDDNGDVVADSVAKYYPFGSYRQEPTDEITEIGFTGHRHNDDVGLIYANARFYLPEIGRFANADTIVPNPANPQSLNRYSYTENRPLNLTDPTGHFGVFGAVVGGVIGGVITGGAYALRTQFVDSEDFSWSEFGTAVGVGAVGGALVGSGIGVMAGAAVLSGAATTATTTAVGAGTGVFISANVYTASAKNFDQSDFVVTSVAGGIDGAIAARFPASGFNPALSRSVSSGFVGAGESIASDIFNQQTIDWRGAGTNGLVGLSSAGFAEGITGGFFSPYPYTLRQPSEIRPTQWLDTRINSREIRNTAFSQTRILARTVVQDFTYGLGINQSIPRILPYLSRPQNLPPNIQIH